MVPHPRIQTMSGFAALLLGLARPPAGRMGAVIACPAPFLSQPSGWARWRGPRGPLPPLSLDGIAGELESNAQQARLDAPDWGRAPKEEEELT